jgi:SAM-dependent methyltransferase
LGILKSADYIHFAWQHAKSRRKNRLFQRSHPGFAFPPAYLAYESYGMDYQLYFEDGLEVANWLIGHFRRHVKLEDAEILDWGCGPGRVIRRFPELLPPSCRCHGSDYNRDSVEWCKGNIPDVAFALNGLHPPLAYPPGKFTVAYGISVLTHLSSDLQSLWVAEIKRVLRPDGICFLTTHGACFRGRLSDVEREKFDRGSFVERGNVQNGHRTFTSFHPPAYMRKLLQDSGLELIEHIEGGSTPGRTTQDIWIAKPARSGGPESIREPIFSPR